MQSFTPNTQLFSYRKFWAKRFGVAPFLPMSRGEMEILGWDNCDIIIVTGDAYVDHPSFGMAIIGRLLEAQGFRVGIISQPDWKTAEAFKALGKPNLFYGITAGNMDSMVNHYTADRKIRTDDPYTPNGEPNKRPNRAVIVYAQRSREAYPEVPIILGGIEASLRRFAYYDYWADQVRRSILIDSKADILVYGNGERAIVEIAHRLARREEISSINDVRGTAFVVKANSTLDLAARPFCALSSESLSGLLSSASPSSGILPSAPLSGVLTSAPSSGVLLSVPSSRGEDRGIQNLVAQSCFLDPAVKPRDDGANAKLLDDDANSGSEAKSLDDGANNGSEVKSRDYDVNCGVNYGASPRNDGASLRHDESAQRDAEAGEPWYSKLLDSSIICLPSYEQVKSNKMLFAAASRQQYLETNPLNARILVQPHGDRMVWVNPPPIPLTTPELDGVYDLPYSRKPHPSYGSAKIRAFEMIRFSVNILRGCFGGCSFCAITAHEGRIIQNRSTNSILREIENIRDKTCGFTGIISDLGGPTANMYQLHCSKQEHQKLCRRFSCVYPNICKNLNTNHNELINLYRQSSKLSGIKKVLIGSGVRYDLAIKSPEYIRELVTHHVGGYLKIAPEHICAGPLSKMMKPGIATYDEFKKLFDKFSHAAGKEQYLIPYFIAAHPGTTDEDMLELAIWLKANKYRLEQVQNFIPTPMTLATTMYYSALNPLSNLKENCEHVFIPKSGKTRQLHKAFLRYYDPKNWPLLRQALLRMGRSDLIGKGKQCLVPRGFQKYSQKMF